MNLEAYGKLTKDYNLINDNHFKIKCICDYFIVVDNVIKLTNLIKYLEDEKQKYLIIGGGCNIILPEFYHGVVIKLLFNDLLIDKYQVEVGASYNLSKLAMDTVNLNLAGLEWAAQIPGTVGGAVIGNAGANAANINGILEWVDKLEVLENHKIKIMRKNDFEYGYRYTNLKTKNIIIIKVYLTLEKGKKSDLLQIIKDNSEKRMATQPLEYPSVGSIFRNPEGHSAGKLIEDAHLKGYKIGGAMVSEKHANFIINYDNATSEDIIKLIKHVHNEVLKKYNIDLKVEPQIIE